MTPAELKTIRESLGLPLQWVADQAKVQLRSAQYWESGQRSVPDDVAKMLLGLDEQFWQLVADYMAQVKEIVEENGALPEEVVLIRYKTDADLWKFHPEFRPIPANAHAALISRTRRGLWELGVPSIIEYMEPAEYKAWLNGREDDEEMRSEWALSKSAE